MSTSRLLAIAGMAAAAMNMSPVPSTIGIRRAEAPPAITLDRFLPQILHVGRHAERRYIKRPLWTVARDKRRARKARNVRRCRLAMKRRGRQ